jgi:hypothetical protein
MGASGDLIICKFGHQVLWIDEHMYWGGFIQDQYEAALRMNCPICGASTKYNFCHYGDPNDCLERYQEQPLRWLEDQKRWTIENLTPIELEQARVQVII